MSNYRDAKPAARLRCSLVFSEYTEHIKRLIIMPSQHLEIGPSREAPRKASHCGNLVSNQILEQMFVESSKASLLLPR